MQLRIEDHAPYHLNPNPYTMHDFAKNNHFYGIKSFFVVFIHHIVIHSKWVLTISQNVSFISFHDLFTTDKIIFSIRITGDLLPSTITTCVIYLSIHWWSRIPWWSMVHWWSRIHWWTRIHWWRIIHVHWRSRVFLVSSHFGFK